MSTFNLSASFSSIFNVFLRSREVFSCRLTFRLDGTSRQMLTESKVVQRKQKCPFLDKICLLLSVCCVLLRLFLDALYTRFLAFIDNRTN